MTQRHVVTGLVAGAVYEVRVRGIAGLVRGPFAVTSTAADADTTPPDAPTNLAATGITRAISVSWSLPVAPDLAAVEVWENISSNAATRYFVGETRGTGFVRTGLLPNVTRWYWVRARDLSGNQSAFVGPVSATTTLLVANDIADGILNTAKFASTIRPVEIVSSLPTTGNAQGRTVFLTTDNKLYRWTGSAWTAAVPTVDLTGQITTTQITDGAISTPKLNALAVTAEKIATNAVTSDKITANAITVGKVAAGAIRSTEIAAGEIRAVNLASETLITQAAQLGTAVVGTAQIGDLQVTTLKIGNDSVTKTSSAVRNDTIKGATTHVGVLSATIFLPETRDVHVQVFVGQDYTGGADAWTYILRQNGTQIGLRSSGAGPFTTAISIGWAGLLGVGTYEFRVDATFGGDSPQTANRSILVFSRVK